MYLCLMLLFHIVDDYFLQGMCLSNLKQKDFWDKNVQPLYTDGGKNRYRYDYLMALFCHALSWSVMIMIPCMLANEFIWWLVPINCAIHFGVDHLKANMKKINLITDQTIHFIQIILTYLVCFVWL